MLLHDSRSDSPDLFATLSGDAVRQCFKQMILPLALFFALLSSAAAQNQKNPEWDKTLELAKKEGKTVVSIPASAEMRKLFDEGFRKRFAGIDLELIPARGTSI